MIITPHSQANLYTLHPRDSFSNKKIKTVSLLAGNRNRNRKLNLNEPLADLNRRKQTDIRWDVKPIISGQFDFLTARVTNSGGSDTAADDLIELVSKSDGVKEQQGRDEEIFVVSNFFSNRVTLKQPRDK